MGIYESGIIFLGLCERAAYVREGNTNLFKWNVIGLKNIVLSYIYPIKLGNLSIGLAIDLDKVDDVLDLRLVEKNGEDVSFISVKLTKEDGVDSGKTTLNGYDSKILVAKDNWAVIFVQLEDSNILINHPGIYHLCLAQNNELKVIGQLNFGVINPLPLTEERIAAIKSDPNARSFYSRDYRKNLTHYHQDGNSAYHYHGISVYHDGIPFFHF